MLERTVGRRVKKARHEEAQKGPENVDKGSPEDASWLSYNGCAANTEKRLAAQQGFSRIYTHFRQALSQWTQSVFQLVDVNGTFTWFTSKLMQFGGSHLPAVGPAVGHGLMEALCEITRLRFDAEDQTYAHAEALRCPDLKDWMRVRGNLAIAMAGREALRERPAAFRIY